MESLFHNSTLRWLSQAAENPAGSYVFFGEPGHGKLKAAKKLGELLNVGANPNSYMTIVKSDEGKTSIGVEQIRRLTADLSLRAFGPQTHRVVVIVRAEELTSDSQNALLKLIEEPPERTVIILTVTDISALLPTVRSRTQSVYFPPLTNDVIRDFLIEHDGVARSLAIEVTPLSKGSIGIARALVGDTKLLELYKALDAMVDEALGPHTFAKLMIAKKLVDSKTPIDIFVGRLQARIETLLRSGNSDTSLELSRLEAIHRYLRRIANHLTPKVALESLLLEV
jgi:hypothetical protein